jgi:colanic acid/amylovoran biosynthesis glycosyltransferase
LKAIIFRTQLFKPSETFITEQAAAMVDTSVLLMGRKVFGPPDRRLAFSSPALSRIAAIEFVLGGDVSAFLSAARQFAPSVIHAHFAIDGLYALPIAKDVGVPLVTTLHGFDITTKRSEFLRSGKPALMRYALLQERIKRQGSVFICVSEFIRQKALEAGFPEHKLLKHFIGIDTKSFQPAHARPVGPVLLHVARLVEKKGTSYLIRAFAEVVKRMPDANLRIVGGGPLLRELTALAKELSIERSVSFLGVQPHSEVRSQLEQASALVLPSVTAANGDAEGLGMVLLEAAASGLPAIGTHHGGIPEAIRDGVTGILVPERNVPELADAMLTLLRNDAMRERMGRQARQMVEEEFDIAKQSRSLQEVYRSASR